MSKLYSGTNELLTLAAGNRAISGLYQGTTKIWSAYKDGVAPKPNYIYLLYGKPTEENCLVNKGLLPDWIRDTTGKYVSGTDYITDFDTTEYTNGEICLSDEGTPWEGKGMPYFAARIGCSSIGRNILPLLRNDSSYTLEFFIKYAGTTISSTTSKIMAQTEYNYGSPPQTVNASFGDIAIYLYSTSIRGISVNFMDSTSRIITELPLNQWIHFALVYDSSQHSIYCYADGKQIYAVSGTNLFPFSTKANTNITSYKCMRGVLGAEYESRYADTNIVISQLAFMDYAKYTTEFTPSKRPLILDVM